MDESQEKTYWSKEISTTIGIANSTLRKWCRLLEIAGYRFLKDDQNRRAYTEHDVILLRHLKELTIDNGIKLETAINVVISRFGGGAVRDVALSDMAEISQDAKRYDQIIERLDHQESFNRTLLERLDQQNSFIERTIKNRDEQLMKVLREMQESKLQIAAANENRSWFKKLLGLSKKG